MDRLLESLQKITKKYLFEKKFLIMPSYLDGNTLQKNLSCQGFSALNLRIITLFDLAKDICFDTLAKKRWKILDSTLGQVIVLQILKELSARDQLVYFRLPLMTPGLAKSIFRTIKEMRISGYSFDHWLSDREVGSGKMEDLSQIRSDYEDQLQKRNLIDEAELYSLAINTTLKEDKSIFFVPSNIQLNELELKFFNEKIRSRAYILKLPCPEAMVVPHSFSLTDFRDAEQSPEKKVFDFLNRREETSEGLPDLDIEFYQTFGENIETREVLRTIAEKRIPYDQIQVFYTVQEPYSQYFYQLSNLYHIPLTFHSGIHIKNSHPAKLLFSLMDWLNM